METLTPVSEFRITVEQKQDFEFRVRFDNEQLAPLEMDEPPPLGKDSGPNAVRILAAAVGNCLAASLLFCARKARLRTGVLTASVTTQTGRTESGRLRVTGMDVEIDPQIHEDDTEKAAQCLAIFEDFCTVTQSVRQGITVNVRIRQGHGRSAAPVA